MSIASDFMETHDYVDAMFLNSLIPQITKPTRITPTTATLIDIVHCICNDILGEQNQLQGILYSDISDHFPIFVLITYYILIQKQHRGNMLE